MDHARFDAFTRGLALAASRRGVTRGVGAATLGAVLGVFATHESALACKENGKKCKKSSLCCSGTCKGKKRKKKCRPFADARGCTIEDGCAEVPCPDFPNGLCYVTVTGKPFCATTGGCFACRADADCFPDFGANAHCVTCPSCGDPSGLTACELFEVV
jgi:hypothetical protein